MADLEGGNIRRQYLSKIVPLKLVPLTKDVPTPSEFLVGNNLNDRIETTETSQNMLQTYPILPITRIQNTCKDFLKTLEIKTRG